MSDSTKKPESASQPAAARTAGGEGQAPAPPQQQQISVDDSHSISAYANFCRVTGTPEELIIDFGLNSQVTGMQEKPIIITQRIIINYFTAKRMLAALQMSVQRHEGLFGVLETDIQKRVKMQPQVR
jgi:hypothetical protein